MFHSDIDAGKISFNELLVLSLGIHIIFLGGALFFRGSNPSLPHSQSITVEIKGIDLPDTEVKPKTKERSTARPAIVRNKSELARSSSPATPVQQTEIQPLSKKEEMLLPAQIPTIVTAPPATAAPVLTVPVRSKTPVQQTVAAGTASKGAPQPNSIDREYTALIRGLIDQQKEYPLLARKSGAEGTVYIKFVLARDGRLKHAEVSRSSGRNILDRAAVHAVTRVNKFPVVPESMVGAELTFELPLAYKLAGN